MGLMLDFAYISQNKKALKKEFLSKSGLLKKKFALLSGSTIGEIKNIFELFLLERGIQPEFFVGGYNRFYEESVFENAALLEYKPDFVYLHISSRNIRVFPDATHTQEQVDIMLEEEFLRIQQTLDALKKHECAIITNNFEMLYFRALGNMDSYSFNGRLNFINRLNQKLYEYVNSTSGVYINDINYLSACFGIYKWSEPKYWYLYKYCLCTDAMPILCKNLAAITAAALGKSKKALVLDLDNTLWNGVVGEVGKDGIGIGEETPKGYAYKEFQLYLNELKKRGVLLNVCSKNDEKNAIEAFLNTGNVLKKDDFIVFMANWEEKHTNIEKIAQTLNILPESIVFADDNPAERELVNQRLPEVCTPLLSDAENYIFELDSQCYFEPIVLAEDDKKRSEFYNANIQRLNIQKDYENYDDYLLSLEMTSRIAQIDETNLKRCVQLINKTNQFNTTGIRYSEGSVKEYTAKSHIGLCFTLSDKFGDNGIVSVVIGVINNKQLVINSWVMSCRVFKRKLEYLVLDYLINICKKHGLNCIKAMFVDTGKNSYAKGVFEELGFKGFDNESFFYEINESCIEKNAVIGVLADE